MSVPKVSEMVSIRIIKCTRVYLYEIYTGGAPIVGDVVSVLPPSALPLLLPALESAPAFRNRRSGHSLRCAPLGAPLAPAGGQFGGRS